MPRPTSFMWLAAGTLFFGVSIRTSVIPVAAWLALAFTLRAVRVLPAFPGLAYVGLALYIALAVANHGYIPIGSPAYFFAIAGITVTMIAPFAADRFLASRMTGWISTLIFPMAWVGCEFARARLTPGASWGSIAYTQYGNLPLMQLVAFTGIWGISFLIAWFASIMNWAWEQSFVWSRIRPVTLGYAILVCVLLGGGGLRLALAKTNGRPIRAAVVSFPKDMFVPGEVTRIVEGRVDEDQRPSMDGKIAHLHDWFFENTIREARSGARLVAWPEQSLLVFKEDEPAFLERAQRLAADERIYLAMGIAAIRVGATRPLENKVVLVDPAGKIAYSYLKSRPAAPEAAIMVRGDSHLPVVATEQGRMASAICFEADFPELVRQIGRGHADLWIVPANDWEAIKRIHFEMAVFRAVENGTPMLRPTSSGFSGASDPWGRVLGVTDHFSGARTLISQVPLGSVRTVYSYIGDLFAWLCVVGVVASVVAAIRIRVGDKNRSIGGLHEARSGASEDLQTVGSEAHQFREETPPMQAKSPEEICRLFQRYMAEGDVESLLSIYDSEAVVLTQSGEAKKGQGLREQLASVAAAKPQFDFNIRQVIQSGDIALMHTDWKVSSPRQMFEYAIEVARRQPDGTWRWLIGDPFTVGKRTAMGTKIA